MTDPESPRHTLSSTPSIPHAPATGRRERILWIDYARAISILAIIVIHSHYFIINTPYGGTSEASNKIFIDIFQNSPIAHYAKLLYYTLYSFRLPLLFFISGLVYSLAHKRESSFRKFASKKIDRLIIPFLITTIFLGIPVKYISGYWDTSTNILADIFKGQFLQMGYGASHLWFLLALFQVFIFYWTLEHITINWKLPPLTPLIISIAIYPLRFILPNVLDIPSVVNFCMFFAIGAQPQTIGIIESKFTRYATLTKVIIYWILAICCIYYINMFHSHFSIHPTVYKALSWLTKLTTGIIGITGVILAAKVLSKSQWIKNNRCITFFKDNTFKYYQYSDPFNYIIIAFIATDLGFAIFGTPERLPLVYLTRYAVTLLLPTLIIILQNKAKKHLTSPSLKTFLKKFHIKIA